MKQVFKIAPLALAVAALSFTGVTNASGYYGYSKEGATITKKIKVEKDVKYDGTVAVTGTIEVNALGMAVINDEQDSDDNKVTNNFVDNRAGLTGDALNGAKGNIGVNMSSGDNNVQGNSVALAAADMRFLLGSADAEVFLDQNADDNEITNKGVVNSSVFNGNALMGASGNVGVNISTGAGNVQHNALAGAVASGSMGEATIATKQETENNVTTNRANTTTQVTSTELTLSPDAENPLTGEYISDPVIGEYQTVGGRVHNIRLNQDGDVYVEVWRDDGAHNQGGGAQLWGHIDYDDNGPFIVADGQRQDGTFSFRGNGRITPNSETGSFEFTETGTLTLAGALTGHVVHTVKHYVRHQNNSVLAGNALKGATGNIGVNITAGSNNLQSNSLALSRVNAPAGGENVPGGTEGGL